MKKNRIKDLKEIIPVANYDEQMRCFQLRDGTYADIYRIISKDLVNGDPDDIEMDCFTWAKFYKTYGSDIEIVSMMFPCDTTRQQDYWSSILEKNENPVFEPMIRRKISELEYRERHTLKKEFFVIFFWKTKEEARTGRRTLESTLGIKELDGAGDITNLLAEATEIRKEQVLFKFANKNSQIF